MKLQDVKGIGDSTAEKLVEMGIDTVGALANASAEQLNEIEEAVNRPAKTVKAWQKSAAEMVADADEVVEVVELDEPLIDEELQAEIDEKTAEIDAEVQAELDAEAAAVAEAESGKASVEHIQEEDTLAPEDFIEKVVDELLEKGFSRRAIMFRAGLHYNPEHPEFFTQFIKQNISVKDNVRLAISKLK